VCYILFVRKQFETRVRLVIYMDQLDLNALTAKAKLEGRVLVAWAREVLMREIAPEPTYVHKNYFVPAVAGLSPAVGNYTPTPEVREASGNSVVHTAKSNRLTCMCATCTAHRKLHDLPLCGLPKKAKRQ
jgi:hypothetical protein